MTQPTANIHKIQFEFTPPSFRALHVNASCPVKVMPSLNAPTISPETLLIQYFTNTPEDRHFTYNQNSSSFTAKQNRPASDDNVDSILIYLPNNISLDFTMKGPLAKLECETTGLVMVDLDVDVRESWIKAQKIVLYTRAKNPTSLILTDGASLDLFYNGQGLVKADFLSSHKEATIHVLVHTDPDLTFFMADGQTVVEKKPKGKNGRYSISPNALKGFTVETVPAP
ncbi:MAG: hypothetical protein WC612_05400 [Bdellovibrionales bacterium]|jgi:hypothetical protein